MTTFSYDNYLDLIVTRDGKIEEDFLHPIEDDDYEIDLDKQIDDLQHTIDETAKVIADIIRGNNNKDLADHLSFLESIMETKEVLEKIKNGDYENEDFDD